MMLTLIKARAVGIAVLITVCIMLLDSEWCRQLTRRSLSRRTLRNVQQHNYPDNSDVNTNQRYDELAPFCATLEASGTSVDTEIDDNHIVMHEGSWHTMYFPAPRSNYYINVPAKSGNHNWRGLFYRLWMGKAPKNFDTDVDQNSGRFTIMSSSRLLGPLNHMWMLVRNPYVRLLSIYLEKFNCNHKVKDPSNPQFVHMAGENFYYRSSHMFRNYGELSFEQYVIALTHHIVFASNRGAPALSREFMELWIRSRNKVYGDNLTKNGSGLANYAKPVKIWGDADVHYEVSLPNFLPDPQPCAKRHSNFIMSLIDPTGRVRNMDLPDPALVSPAERAYRLCTNDHHTCVQSSGLYKQQPGLAKVLRLEEQDQWYVQFLRCFGITKEQVVGEEWRDFEGQDCFYTPTGDCKDALAVLNKTELTSGGVHGHSTVDLIPTHYTPLAAELVYYLYEYDFQRLGYQKWDGITTFQLL